MSATQNHHETFTNLLRQSKWDEAQTLWLDLADQLAEQTDFLLLLVKEFSDAGQPTLAAELAALLAPSLHAAGKHHEWLYALKLQAGATHPPDRNLRTELIAAYRQIYDSDPRLQTIFTAAKFEEPTAPLPAAIAKSDILLALNAGNFCQHKSWGVGKIKTFDATLNRLVIVFAHNPDHVMQLPYAADSLVPVSADHIDVRKQTDLTGLKQLASADPVALIRLVLAGHNHAASADKIASILTGTVLAADEWKKWWDNAKKLLKRDPQFEVPAKKNEPVILRTAPVSQQDDLLEAFRVAPGMNQKTEVARQLLKILTDLADPDLLLQEFQDGLLDALQKLKGEHAAERLEAVFVIAELQAHQKTPGNSVISLVEGIIAGTRDLPTLLEELTGPAQKRVVALATDRLLGELNRLPARILDELAVKLASQSDRLHNLVGNHTASPDLLVWIWKNRTAQAWLQPVCTPAMLLAMLTAVEDGGAKATKRLRDLLHSEEELIPELLSNADTETVRDIARRILNSPAFEELDRRSLMARVVKDFPFVQEFLITKTVKEAPLIVSWASLHKRRAELDEIVSKRIPENSKDIGVARSYGDLRENFEFKAAKDLQKMLMRRRAELEILLSRAQGTDFADTKTDIVGIGTTVTVTDTATSKSHVFHVLGAWDSDPAHGIISYPAALAQAMFNKKTGDTVEAADENGKLSYRIDRIEKTPDAILQTL
ncbi:MAG: GreA/GreB family elongation factor [Verrucomicrobiota bacterium]